MHEDSNDGRVAHVDMTPDGILKLATPGLPTQYFHEPESAIAYMRRQKIGALEFQGKMYSSREEVGGLIQGAEDDVHARR